jgi:methionyl-tRNA synthetase
MAFGSDAQFSDEGFIDRVNNDLANDLGNLASRLLTLIENSSGGALPARPDPAEFRADAALAEDLFALREGAAAALEEFREAFLEYRFHDALAALWGLVSQTNRYIVRFEPWALARDPAKRPLLEAVLRESAEALAATAIALAPVMPESARDLWLRLGGAGDVADHDLLSREKFDPKPLLADGRPIRRGGALFPRIDKDAWFKETRMEKPVTPGAAPAAPAPPTPSLTPAAAPAPAASDLIGIEEFQKVKLRTGKVLSAERIAGADKLLKLTVDMGTETRTVVAGIALQYAPEAMVGRTIIVVANLKPAKLRGVESQGMLLAADLNGKPIVAGFEVEIPPGSTVR